MAVTTKKITTVDTATTFDDVFVNTNGTLRQVTKENFQQASGITALNNNMVAIPSNDNGRLLYIYETDCNLLSQEWVLAGGTNFPSGERFWYVHSIAYVANSDGTIKIGKQIAYAYSSGNISYERLCNNGTWGGWEKLPTRSEVDANTAAIATLNSRIATEVYAGTVSEFLSSLKTLGNSMKIGSFKYIKYTPSETTGKFVNNHLYGGLFERIGSNYWTISLADPEGNPVYGMYRNGTWVWDRIAIGAEVDALNSRTFWKDQIADVTIPANSDTVLTLSKSTKAFIFIASANPDTCGVFICSATSASSKVAFFPVLLGSSLSLSADGDKLTITNSSPSVAYAYGFIVDGSGITA